MRNPFKEPRPDVGKLAVWGDTDRPRVGFIVEALVTDPRVRVVEIEEFEHCRETGGDLSQLGTWHYRHDLFIIDSDRIADLADLAEWLILDAAAPSPAPTRTAS